jgi:hypothetical protein
MQVGSRLVPEETREGGRIFGKRRGFSQSIHVPFPYLASDLFESLRNHFVELDRGGAYSLSRTALDILAKLKR